MGVLPLSNLNNISQKNTHQLIYTTLIMEWKGLSLSGLDIIAKLGASISGHQYNLMKKEMAKKEHNITHNVLKKKQPIIWVDNFCKTFGNSFYNLTHGAYTAANYTAVAMLYAEHPTDMQYIFDVDGNAIPSTSLTMLQPPACAQLLESFRQYDHYQQISFYDNCMANNPQYVDFVVTPQHTYAHHQHYLDSPNGLRNVRTCGMLDFNVSDQNGLVAVLQHIHALSSTLPDQYQSIVIDPGIYWRVYQVRLFFLCVVCCALTFICSFSFRQHTLELHFARSSPSF